MADVDAKTTTTKTVEIRYTEDEVKRALIKQAVEEGHLSPDVLRSVVVQMGSDYQNYCEFNSLTLTWTTTEHS